MRLKKLTLLAFLLILSLSSLRASDKIDSLRAVYNNTANSDSIRMEALYSIGEIYEPSKSDSALYYFNLMLRFSKEKKYDFFTWLAYNTLGRYYTLNANTNKALDHLQKSLNIANRMNDLELQIISLSNIGSLQSQMNDESSAVNSYMKGIALREKAGKGEKNGYLYNNLGVVYMNLSEFEKAEECFNKVLELGKITNNKNLILVGLGNMGTLKENQDLLDESLYYLQKKQPMLEGVDNYSGLSFNYIQMGALYTKLSKYDSAKYYLNEALAASDSANSQANTIETYVLMSSMYDAMDDYYNSVKYATKALELASEHELLRLKERASRLLYMFYKEAGRYRKSLEMHELATTLSDSLINEEKLKEITRTEEKFKYQKQKATDSIAFAKQQEIKDLTITQQAEELEAERNQRILLIIALCLVTLVAVFWYRNYLLKIKTAEIITRQKEQVEIQRDQILEQKDELHTLNEEITSLNDNLEKIVAERTEKLQQSLEAINEHHFQLVHRIRAPLASLLGLLNLINQDNCSMDERVALLNIIQDNSLKIDKVIKDMSEKLSEYSNITV